MSKKNKTAIKYFIKKYKNRLVVLGIIIILILTWQGISVFLATQQKKKLSTIEHDITIVLDNVTKRLDTSLEIQKYCKRDAKKFGGGTLRCLIELTFVSSQTNKAIKEIEEGLTKEKWDIQKSKNFDDKLSTGLYKHIASGIECKLDVFEVNREIPEINIKCLEESRRAFYPLQQ